MGRGRLDARSRRARAAAPRSVRLRVPELQPDRDRDARPRTSRCRRSTRACRRPSGTQRAQPLLDDARPWRAARAPAEPTLGRPAAARLDRARADERRAASSSPTSRPARSTARAAPKCMALLKELSRAGPHRHPDHARREVAAHAQRVIEITDGRIVQRSRPQPTTRRIHDAGDAATTAQRGASLCAAWPKPRRRRCARCARTCSAPC